MTDAARQFLEAETPKLSPRDASLVRLAVESLCRNTIQSEEVPWAPHRGIIPSHGTYRGVWNWDAAFHALAAVRWDAELAWEQLEIFLEWQQPNGGFIDVLFESGDVVSDFGKPPVWPWAAQRMALRAPGTWSIERFWDPFLRYEQHWVRDRSYLGLFHYDTRSHEGDWLQKVKYESGWDNSPRWDEGIVGLWPVDLNGYMVLLYQAMEFFAERLGAEPDPWHEKAANVANLIEERLWSEEHGAYCDFDYSRQCFTGVLTPASFVPLFAGCASTTRAAKMAELAADPGMFFPGMPTVAYSQPSYSRDMWRGPCWLNTAFFSLEGLRRYGHHEVARSIEQTILDWCASETELREYYDAKTGEGLAAVGFGWTAAFVIELILRG